MNSIAAEDTGSRKQEENYRITTKEIIQILNEPGDIQNSVHRIIDVLKTRTGFDAVGIRLQEGDDFPYMGQSGFSSDFIKTENSLIEYENNGNKCRDNNGKLCLACTCGKVITGKLDPENPFVTSGGSWWTNDSFQLLKIPFNEDDRFRPRNLCIHNSFASIALIPIRKNEKIFGMVQLNDYRKNVFNSYLLDILEGIASHIGDGLMRKLAEEALFKNEELLRNITENAPDIIIQIDKKGTIQYLNRAIWGNKKGNSIGMNFCNFALPEYHEMLNRSLEQVFNETSVQSIDFRGLDNNKECKWYRAIISPVKNSEVINNSIMNIRDITQQKQAEINLQQSEERYRSLFVGNNTVSLLIKPDTGDIVDANPSASNFYGWTHSELCSLKISDINILSKEGVAEVLQKAKDKKINHFFFKHRLANNEIKDVEVYSYPIRFTDSTFLYSEIHDITESKRTAEIIRKSEISRNAILQTAMDGFWLLDLQGKLLEVNESYCKMSGYSEQELLNMYIYDFEDVETKEITANHIKMIVDIGEDRFESRHRRKDGSFFNIEISCKYQSDQGGQLVVFLHDITKRKQTEKALIESEILFRESQKAASIGSYKTVFSSGLWESSEALDNIFGIDNNYIKNIEGWLDIIHPEERETMKKYLIEEIIEKGLPFDKEYRIIRKNDGAIKWIHGLGKVDFDRNNKVKSLIGTIQDVTDRKIKEETLKKLNQSLTALSMSRQFITQFFEEADYLNEICKIIVEYTDYSLVWIGFAENDENKTIRPVASAGFRDDYLNKIKVRWDDSDFGRGPTGTAVRTGEVKMCNNMLTDPDFEPWRENALKHGFASSIVFPLKSGDKIFGAISIYSVVPYAFLDFEINLLSELAIDVANGITTIRLRMAHLLAEKALSMTNDKLEELVKERTKELLITNDLLKTEIRIRKQQEQNLKKAEEKYRTVANYATNWEFWISPDDKVIYCSPSCERISGYKASEFFESSNLFFDIVNPDDLKIYEEHKIKEKEGQIFDKEIQYRITKKDGSMIWIGHYCQPIFDEDNIFMGTRGSNKDITEKKEIQKNILKAIIQTEEKEREHFSKELHDGLGPLLTTIKIYLESLMRPKTEQSRNEIIESAKEILEDSISTVKEISNNLSPHLLTNYGFNSAIKSFVEKLNRTTKIKIILESNISRRINQEIETSFYRSIIECINNSLKHANAKNINIKMTDTGNQLLVLYKDDGVGFNVDETLLMRDGLGLFNIQNRIQNIGGEVIINSKSGFGVDYQFVINL